VAIGTIDEEGMARPAERSLRSHTRLVTERSNSGIPPYEIFFNPLALLPISTGIEEDRANAMPITAGIRRMRQELPGCRHIILGVFNISVLKPRDWC